MNDIRVISAAQTYPLRGTVLRPGQAASESIYPHDNDEGTVHFGAFEGDAVIGIASLFVKPLPEGLHAHIDKDTNQWQLRGMAVDERYRGQGHGRQLIDVCLSYVCEQDGRLLWCNARVSAQGFYEAAGFKTEGEEFYIPLIGPHYVMWRLVG